MARVPTISLVICMSAGCVDFDRLQAGLGSEVTTPDAGGDAAGGSDASTDASTDAGSDAPSSEAGTRFCAGTSHAFCDDFDGPATLLAEPRISGGGQAQTSNVRSLSAPLSLFTTLPQRTTERERATLGKSFPGNWRRIIVEADVFLETPSWQPADVNAAIMMVELVSETTTSAEYVAINSTRTGLTGLGAATGGGTLPPSWSHLRLDFNPATGAELKLGPDVIATAPITSPPTAGPSPSMRVSVGVNGFNAPAPTITVYFDNLTVDFP